MNEDNLHHLFGMHQTGVYSWKPEKGHALKEIHDRALKLLGRIEDLEGEITRLKTKVPWYKKIFK